MPNHPDPRGWIAAAFLIHTTLPGSGLAARACPVTPGDLTAALKASVKPSAGPSNGGLHDNEWAAVVDRSGQICALTFSGAKPGEQWLGSRAIAAEKATTANAMGLNSFAISTANLYAGAHPGGPFSGLSEAAWRFTTTTASWAVWE